MQLNLPPFAQVSPKGLLDRLQDDIRQLKREVAKVKSDLHTFQDIQHLKSWLKSDKAPRKHELDDVGFDGMPFPFGY